MTAVQEPAVDQRDCALYRFWVRHPVTGQIVLGYVGETARMPFVRLMEHVTQQPWADTIVRWEVDDVVYRGKDAVLAAERSAIRRERPLYNVEGNAGNPDRIRPWQAVKQRQAREPGWQPPAKTRYVPGRRAGNAAARRRGGWRESARFAGRCVYWTSVVLLGGWIAAVAASGPVATWYDGIAYGVGLTTVLVCTPWLTLARLVVNALSRRRRKRARRRR